MFHNYFALVFDATWMVDCSSKFFLLSFFLAVETGVLRCLPWDLGTKLACQIFVKLLTKK